MAELFGVLQPAVKFIGLAIAVFGMVQLGMVMKDGLGGGGQLGGALGFMIAGFLIAACASMVSLPK